MKNITLLEKQFLNYTTKKKEFFKPLNSGSSSLNF